MLKGLRNPTVKKWLIALFVLLLAGAAVIGWLFNLKHEDTATIKAAYTIDANVFMKEFKQDLDKANKKYAEQIITVNGNVSEIEMADTTANIKMIDTASGAYIIFAFQQQHLGEARALMR